MNPQLVKAAEIGKQALFWVGRFIRKHKKLTFIVVVAIAGYFYFFGGPSRDGSAARNTPLPTEPRETVRTLFQYIAHSQPETACRLFSPEGAKAFATHLGGENCEQAVRSTSGKVRDKSGYSRTVPDKAAITSGSNSHISSCEMDLTAEVGPRLGEFTLRKQTDGGWLITGHETEPEDCATR